MTTTSAPSWHPGAIVNEKYRIDQVVGVGGYATVYRVRHCDWDIDLAVKVPHKSLIEQRADRERFLREAHTWIELGVHPNVVQCWFVEEWEGDPVLVLDFLSGGSLRQLQRSGRIKRGDWRLILDLAIQACDGLAHAHGLGVVHRDIKPGNLLMSADGNLCVTDFGLVKTGSWDTGAESGPAESGGLPELPADFANGASLELRRRGGGGLTSLTSTGSYLGTPEYGAPEQWGQARHVGARADIYALAVVLYELCCARRPFDDGVHALEPALLVARHLSMPPPDPRLFRADIPDRLADLILRCLAKDPDQRPSSVRALREELTDLYKAIVSQPYPRGMARAAVQRADALNSKAVSFWNLGRSQDAFDAWQEAATMDALHPETVYNRSLLQWRLGQIPHSEVVRRLTQVKATYRRATAYLGYFHLERCCAQPAAAELSAAVEFPEVAQEGAAWRALGDARMYLEDFEGAEAAYRQAVDRMPSDIQSDTRLEMASSRVRGKGRRLLFPLTRPRLTLTRTTVATALAVTGDGRHCLLAEAGGLELWDLLTGERRWSWQQLFESGGGTVSGLRLTGTGHVLSVETPTGRIWALSSGKCLHELKGRELFYAMVPGTDLAIAGRVDLHLVKIPTGEPIRSLIGHGGLVTSVAVTPDGRQAVSGSLDRSVRVWDLETGAQVHAMTGHTDVVKGVALSPGTGTALSGSLDGTIRQWSLTTGDCLRTLQSEAGQFKRIVLSTPEFAVVSRTREHHDFLDVWDIRGAELAFTRRGGEAVPMHGGRYLLVGSDGGDGELVLWELPSGRVVRAFPGRAGKITALAASVYGQLAVSACSDATVSVFEVGETTRAFERSLVVSRTRRHSEAEGTSRTFRELLSRAWEAFEGGDIAAAHRFLEMAREVTGYGRDPDALALNARLLAHLGRVRVRAVWELRSFSEQDSIPARAVAVSGDGKLAISAAGRLVRLWELATGCCLRGFAAHQGEVRAVALAHDGSLMASGGEDGTVRVWDVATGQCSNVFSADGSRVRSLALSPNGRFVYAGTQGRLHAIDLEQGRVAASFEASECEALRLGRDGSLALCGGNGLSLWELATGRRLLAPEDFQAPGPVVALDITADGAFGLTGGGDSLLRLWDLRTGRCLKELSGHTGPIPDLDLTSDGCQAISAGQDGTLRLWDLTSGNCLETIDVQAGPVVGVAMTLDGRFAVSAGADRRLRLWEFDWELDPAQRRAALGRSSRGFLGRVTSLFRRR
ncbi:MAG: protein kinase [Armatimonadetes bacterium]|nr:protein kinase [Armatimonadota bacterium]